MALTHSLGLSQEGHGMACASHPFPRITLTPAFSTPNMAEHTHPVRNRNNHPCPAHDNPHPYHHMQCSTKHPYYSRIPYQLKCSLRVAVGMFRGSDFAGQVMTLTVRPPRPLTSNQSPALSSDATRKHTAAGRGHVSESVHVSHTRLDPRSG